MKKIDTKKINSVLKIVWVAAVLSGLSIYLYKNWADYTSILMDMKPQYIIYSALFLIAAKLLLAINVQLSAGFADLTVPFFKALYMYTVTQLAKYIPGSIWHFVGRIGMYRKEGISNERIRLWMITENVFLLSGALISGSIIILVTRLHMIEEIIRKLNVLLLVPAAAIIIVCAAAIIYRRHFIKIITPVIQKLKLSFLMVILEIVIWCSLGLFWVSLVAQFSYSPSDILYHSGVFALAYVLGFIIPIAPAGIGVRESVLVLGLTPYVSIQTAVSISTVSRAVFIAVEIILATVLLIINNLINKQAEISS